MNDKLRMPFTFFVINDGITRFIVLLISVPTDKEDEEEANPARERVSAWTKSWRNTSDGKATLEEREAWKNGQDANRQTLVPIEKFITAAEVSPTPAQDTADTETTKTSDGGAGKPCIANHSFPSDYLVSIKVRNN